MQLSPTPDDMTPRKLTYLLVTWFTGHWDVTAVDDGHLGGAEVRISTELSSVRDDDEGLHLRIETEVRKPQPSDACVPTQPSDACVPCSFGC